MFLLAGWLHPPSDPIWLFGLFWSTLFTFVAIPLSILAGGSWIAKSLPHCGGRSRNRYMADDR